MTEAPLKQKFQTLFGVYSSMQKNESVSNMGYWEGRDWKWNLIWRKRLFEWELVQVQKLIGVLHDVKLSCHVEDSIWWKFILKGAVSVKSFSNACWDLIPHNLAATGL